MKKTNRLISLFITFAVSGFIIIGCGKSSIEIDNSTYEPKIAINGLLNPELTIQRISIGRNFPLGQTIDLSSVALTGAQVKITELSSGNEHTLTFNPNSGYFELHTILMKINYGLTYRLDVSTTIDGKELSASSTTTVPAEGMAIIPGESLVGDMVYRQKDINGELIAPVIAFSQSENVAFYLLSFMAADTSDASFIYDNPMGFKIEDMRKDGGSARDLQYGDIWKRLEDDASHVNNFESNWFWFWFYGEYRFILYGGDVNYYHYLATHANVMGMDGNLHEPIFDIDGDGIGVFGSVITDTVYVNVLRP